MYTFFLGGHPLYRWESKGQRREKGYEAQLFLALLNGTGTQDGASGKGSVLWVGMFVSLTLQVSGKHKPFRQGGKCRSQSQEPGLIDQVFSLFWRRELRKEMSKRTEEGVGWCQLVVSGQKV